MDDETSLLVKDVAFALDEKDVETACEFSHQIPCSEHEKTEDPFLASRSRIR